MKAYSKILIFAATASLLAGCNFFDNNSPSGSMPNEMYSSVANTELAVAGVYELFGGDRGYRNRLTCGYAGINTDIEYNRKKGDYATYQIKPSDTDLSNFKGNDAWGYLTAIIERANGIVDGIDMYGYPGLTDTKNAKSDSLKFDYLKGEALFLRSFALLEMVKYWGDVPVNVKAFDGTKTEEVSGAKVDRNIAFEQIRKDLKLAADLMEWSGTAQLPAAQNDVRRPSKAAALALLARADLMYAGKAVRPTKLEAGCSTYSITWNADQNKRDSLYREIIAACDTIINYEGATKLKANYEQIFKDLCQDHVDYSGMEFIWVIPMANGARGQFLQYNCAKFNSTGNENQTLGVLLNNKKYSENVSSNFAMSMVPTLLFDYETDDIRRDVTVLPFKWNTAITGTMCVSADYSIFSRSEQTQICLYPKLQADVTQWACGKYRIEWMAHENIGTDDGIDFPVIRMADVYLMRAEASIGSLDGKDIDIAKGQVCWDAVRDRAGLSTKTLTVNSLPELAEERKLEFAGEYIRKWDLMRWGVLKDSLVNTHERLMALCEKYKETNHKIYVKCKLDNSVLQPGGVDYQGKSVVRSFTVDEVYGFNFEETDAPTSVPGEFKWNSANCEFVKRLNNADSPYVLYDYDDPESINARQYWPIFATIVGKSNGMLFNNYGY